MTWEGVAAELRARGHAACVPPLAGALEAGPPHHEKLAQAVAAGAATLADGGLLALVLHSGAGSLAPAIVEALGRPVDLVVFVDAQLPHPGRSWVATAPAALVDDLRRRAVAGRLPPWNEWFEPAALAAALPDAEMRRRFVAELPRVPLDWFEETAPEFDRWRQVPCAYLRLSDTYAGIADRARGSGMHVRTLESGHLAMVHQPARIAGALISMAQDIGLP